jgi:hypothetical protein
MSQGKFTRIDSWKDPVENLRRFQNDSLITGNNALISPPATPYVPEAKHIVVVASHEEAIADYLPHLLPGDVLPEMFRMSGLTLGIMEREANQRGCSTKLLSYCNMTPFPVGVFLGAGGGHGQTLPQVHFPVVSIPNNIQGCDTDAPIPNEKIKVLKDLPNLYGTSIAEILYPHLKDFLEGNPSLNDLIEIITSYPGGLRVKFKRNEERPLSEIIQMPEVRELQIFVSKLIQELNDKYSRSIYDEEEYNERLELFQKVHQNLKQLSGASDEEILMLSRSLTMQQDPSYIQSKLQENNLSLLYPLIKHSLNTRLEWQNAGFPQNLNSVCIHDMLQEGLSGGLVFFEDIMEGQTIRNGFDIFLNLHHRHGGIEGTRGGRIILPTDASPQDQARRIIFFEELMNPSSIQGLSLGNIGQVIQSAHGYNQELIEAKKLIQTA